MSPSSVDTRQDTASGRQALPSLVEELSSHQLEQSCIHISYCISHSFIHSLMFNCEMDKRMQTCQCTLYKPQWFCSWFPSDVRRLTSNSRSPDSFEISSQPWAFREGVPIHVVSNVVESNPSNPSKSVKSVPGDDVEVWSVTQNAWVAGAVQAHRHDRHDFKYTRREQDTLYSSVLICISVCFSDSQWSDARPSLHKAQLPMDSKFPRAR